MAKFYRNIEREEVDHIITMIVENEKIRELVIKGTTDGPEEPTQPDDLGFSPLIAEADRLAIEIIRSFRADLDLIEEGHIFLEARMKITSDK